LAASKDPCEHFATIADVPPRARQCEECAAMGARWNELRVCLACGHVGCCEDSPHAHALAHFNATGHPMIVPLAADETWGWCYVHKRYFDPMPPLAFKQRGALGGFLDRLRGKG
jgi:Zn-finger in ubiquitin-hydrolases and other protein